MAEKKSPTKKILFVLLGLVVLLAAALLIFGGGNRFGGGGEGKIAEFGEVETRNITQVVTASGSIQPEVEVIISTDVSGEIVYLGVKEGDKVRKGDLLGRIEADFYVAQAEQAQAGVAQAKASKSRSRASVLKAQLDFDRAKGLNERGIIPDAEFQTAKTQYDIALADEESSKYMVESAEARLREAREQVSKTRLYAPIDGTISQLNVELGERVVGTSMMTGTEIMKVAQLDKMELEADINENDVVNIALGDTASIEVDAYPEQTFRGVVIEIANSARVSGLGTQEQVTNFPVKIRVFNDAVDAGKSEGNSADLDSELASQSANGFIGFRPGMSGTVDIFTQTVEDAIVVPIAAVTVRDMSQQKSSDEGEGEEGAEGEGEGEEEEKPQGNNQENLKKVVFIKSGNVAKLVEVESGISDDTHIEIRSGLSGDEEIIIGPYSLVSRELNNDDEVSEREEKGGRRGPPNS